MHTLFLCCVCVMCEKWLLGAMYGLAFDDGKRYGNEIYIKSIYTICTWICVFALLLQHWTIQTSCKLVYIGIKQQIILLMVLMFALCAFVLYTWDLYSIYERDATSMRFMIRRINNWIKIIKILREKKREIVGSSIIENSLTENNHQLRNKDGSLFNQVNSCDWHCIHLFVGLLSCLNHGKYTTVYTFLNEVTKKMQ